MRLLAVATCVRGGSVVELTDTPIETLKYPYAQQWGMGDTIYVVERHDADYHGPHKSRHCDGAGVAMRVAESMRDEHRGDEWGMRTSEREGRNRVAFHPRDGASGWVTVTEKPLISD